MILELHVHTKRSIDSNIKPEDIDKYLGSPKIDSILITDHNQAISAELRNNPKVIPAIEFSTDRGEIIGLFIDKIPKSHQADAIIKYIHRQGGLVLIPHPFRNGLSKWDDLVRQIDLIEIHNSRLSRSANNSALSFALSHGIPGVAGSDAHLVPELGLTGIRIKGKKLSLAKIKEALKKGRFEIIKMDYSQKSILSKSKLLKYLRQKNIGKLLISAAKYSFIKTTELANNYKINSFNDDLLQEKLDECYQYGDTWFWRLHHRQRINRVINLIKKLPKKKGQALDLGCGRGIYTRIMKEAGFMVCGIDLSKEEIYWARKFSKNIVFMEKSIESLPFKDNTQDLIICSEVLEHMDNPEKALFEIKRVLKKGGYAIISMPNAFSLYWLRCKILLIFFEIFGLKMRELKQHTRWPFQKIDRFLSSSGLKSVKRSGTFLIFGEPLILKLILKYFPGFSAWLLKIDDQLSKKYSYFSAFYFQVLRKK